MNTESLTEVADSLKIGYRKVVCRMWKAAASFSSGPVRGRAMILPPNWFAVGVRITVYLWKVTVSLAY
jgi:hypothetical protein